MTIELDDRSQIITLSLLTMFWFLQLLLAMKSMSNRQSFEHVQDWVVLRNWKALKLYFRPVPSISKAHVAILTKREDGGVRLELQDKPGGETWGVENFLRRSWEDKQKRKNDPRFQVCVIAATASGSGGTTAAARATGSATATPTATTATVLIQLLLLPVTAAAAAPPPTTTRK